MRLKTCTAICLVVFCNFLSVVSCRYTGDSSLEVIDDTIASNDTFQKDNGNLEKKYENGGPVVRGGGDTIGDGPIITVSSNDMETLKNVPTGIKDTANEQRIEVEAELNRGRGQFGSDVLDYRNILDTKVRRKRALVEKNRVYRWIEGRVFYRIYEDQTSASDNFKPDYIENEIEAAMVEISRKTCIRFTQDNSGKDVDGCSLIIMKGNDGCDTSNAGRNIQLTKNKQEKPQCGAQFTRMSLAPNVCKKGSIMHELLHAIGFHHEHQRPDRDSFVRLKQTEKVQKFIGGKSTNFMTKTRTDEVDTLGTKYDYRSIMHYLRFFDVLDKRFLGLSTSVDEEKEKLYELDRDHPREELSETDIFAINKYYGCVDCRNVDKTEGDCQKLKDRDVNFCESPYKKDVQGCLGFCGFKCPDPKKFKNA